MESIRRASMAGAKDETQPLMRPMSQTHVGSLCFMAMLAGLAIIWCVVDQWNISVANALFTLGDLRMASIDTDLAQEGLMVFHTSKPFPGFNYPLSLAFIQFAFMGLLFLAIYWVLFKGDDDTSVRTASSVVLHDKRWPALIVTHVFSVFWLQALMMPAHVFSLGLFAASRAVEVPVSALLRAPICGAQLGRRTAQTTLLAFAAAATLYFAYAQIASCLCVWSGHGVTLVGAAFWIVYFLVLLVPATNTVLQEGVMKGAQMHPLLMLALMNLFACVLFIPVLLIAHMTGFEDVSEGFAMTVRFREVYMLVAWLCLQMASISAVTVGVILMVDSFWAVALRALRVVYWWLQQVWWFYAGAAMAGQDISMSLACPHASQWTFVMLCGFALALAAISTDRKAEDGRSSKADLGSEARTKPALV